MSSSSVCQGLQSCLMEPRVLWLKLAPPLDWPSPSHSEKSNTESETHPPPPPYTTHESDMKQDNPTINDRGGWSFLQSLCNKTEKPETDKIYVHPMVKRSSSVLSAKSLELCTESLGSETGSNGSESSDDIALLSLERNTSSFTTPESNENCISKRSNRSNTSFPPPLSSMSENGGVQVRPRREDGRLILEAVPTPSLPSYFEAKRSDGRLRLRLFSTSNYSYYDDHESVEAAAEEEEEEGAEIEALEDDDDDETEKEEEENEEDLDENNEKAEDETGLRRIPRPSRCNENGNRSNQMLDWEPFWVAT